MKTEIKNCENCKKDFTIEPDDFGFYEQMKVPPPVWCPMCRLLRRMNWYGYRVLYKRKCELCGESIVSIFKETSFPVYCQNCWWGDKWDATETNASYDFSKNFFENFNLLFKKVPQFSLFNLYSHNSDYCNCTLESKNCYLNFASDYNEDTAYLYHSIENKKCFDMLGSRKNENCYGLVDCERCYGSENLILSEDCIDCKYCYDCRNCQNCFGSFGLRNKNYYVFNSQYTKEEYDKKIKELELNKYSLRKEIENKFIKSIFKYPRKFINSRQTTNSQGNYLNHVKNCKNCFDVEGPAEDLKYVTYGVTNLKDLYDCYAIGMGLEKSYEMLGAGDGLQNSAFCLYTWSGFNNFYSFLLKNCQNCFACIGLRNKSYCILNKQYTKEQYEELVPRIIKHMNDMPYIDHIGRSYGYGEFFPSELSPFCYNETIAQEYFPLTKEEAISQGYRWKDQEERNYNIDIKNEDIPDNIKDVDESIIGKVIECNHSTSSWQAHNGTCNEQCTEAFKIIPQELQFYQRMNLPLPRLCPNCRHYNRLKQRNPLKLWHRQCMKEGCTNTFETSYAPERPEIVYCERCYQQEVY